MIKTILKAAEPAVILEPAKDAAIVVEFYAPCTVSTLSDRTIVKMNIREATHMAERILELVTCVKEDEE